MLLETLDILENDVIIFSENKLDLKNNFKVIFKNSQVKKVESIDYFEVCKFLTDPAPKNLIVYRLLTNVSGLDAFSTNYGYFLNTNGNMELVYFDPAFAIQDLSHLKFNLEPHKFRFKIQQVGFSSSTNENGEAIFEEVFCFDLKAPEAQHQNDRIFAEAIFAKDDSVIWKSDSGRRISAEDTVFTESSKTEVNEFVKANVGKPTDSVDFNSRNIDKLKESFKKDWQSGYEAYNQFKIKSHDKFKKSGKKTRTMAQFIDEHKKDKTDIFKEEGKKLQNTRESIVLKFKTDE
jgi:hypothetical protein